MSESIGISNSVDLAASLLASLSPEQRRDVLMKAIELSKVEEETVKEARVELDLDYLAYSNYVNEDGVKVPPSFVDEDGDLCITVCISSHTTLEDGECVRVDFTDEDTQEAAKEAFYQLICHKTVAATGKYHFTGKYQIED